MAGRRPFHGLWRREGDAGAAAVEFALLAPVFFALLFGVLYLGMLAFTYIDLHQATEDAARCYAVKTTVCVDASTTRTYASSHYHGLTAATFTAAPSPSPSNPTTTPMPACGYQVVGSTTFALFTNMHKYSIPLSATACFP